MSALEKPTVDCCDVARSSGRPMTLGDREFHICLVHSTFEATRILEFVRIKASCDERRERLGASGGLSSFNSQATGAAIMSGGGVAVGSGGSCDGGTRAMGYSGSVGSTPAMVHTDPKTGRASYYGPGGGGNAATGACGGGGEPDGGAVREVELGTLALGEWFLYSPQTQVPLEFQVPTQVVGFRDMFVLCKPASTRKRLRTVVRIPAPSSVDVEKPPEPPVVELILPPEEPRCCTVCSMPFCNERKEAEPYGIPSKRCGDCLRSR